MIAWSWECTKSAGWEAERGMTAHGVFRITTMMLRFVSSLAS